MRITTRTRNSETNTSPPLHTTIAFNTTAHQKLGKRDTMGQRNGFSDGDVAKLNAMYKCNPSSIEEGKPVTAAVPLAASSSSSSSAKPSSSSSSAKPFKTTPGRPLVNFIGNLVRPFLHENVDDADRQDAVEEEEEDYNNIEQNTIDA